MFEIAAATRKEWDSIWKSETELLRFTLAMDDARQTVSRKALDGCSDKAWAMWTAEVAKIPASKFAGLDSSLDRYCSQPHHEHAAGLSRGGCVVSSQ